MHPAPARPSVAMARSCAITALVCIFGLLGHANAQVKHFLHVSKWDAPGCAAGGGTEYGDGAHQNIVVGQCYEVAPSTYRRLEGCDDQLYQGQWSVGTFTDNLCQTPKPGTTWYGGIEGECGNETEDGSHTVQMDCIEAPADGYVSYGEFADQLCADDTMQVSNMIRIGVCEMVDVGGAFAYSRMGTLTGNVFHLRLYTTRDCTGSPQAGQTLSVPLTGLCVEAVERPNIGQAMTWFRGSAYTRTGVKVEDLTAGTVMQHVSGTFWLGLIVAVAAVGARDLRDW